MVRHPSRSWWFACALLAGILPACGGPAPVEALPTPRETLARAGKRLSGSIPIDELSAMAADGNRVLAALTRRERDALARGYLRFRVERPVIVDVAASRRAVPFWLDDAGFARTRDAIDVLGEAWPVFRKAYGAGWVGLGVNGLDRASPAHYVVFVRPQSGGAGGPLASVPEGWRVARARDGVAAASDASLPMRRIPEALRGAILLQPSHDDRHSTLLARGRAWKTHVPSSVSPDQVVVSFGPDAGRSLAWTWRTAPEVADTSLRIAPASAKGDGPADPGSVRVYRGEARVVEIPNLLNDPTIRRHCVRVEGLEPDTAYAYSLGDGTIRGGTPWRVVRTGPTRPARYRFLYLGDAQNGLKAWGELLHGAARRIPDAGFILLAGDLVDRGNERTNWDHFFLRAEGVFDTLPLMPCVGNHEYLDRGPWLYSSVFDLPRNGPAGIDPKLVYWFEYADAFVAVLDSNLALADPQLAKAQAEWLDAALARTRASWKFVMFHHPIYASHTNRENPGLRDAWVPVFDKHHVDLVLQGHDHAYLRTFPMHGNRRVESSRRGTTYIVSVSGDKYYEQDPRHYTEVGRTRLSTYQTIDVEVPERRLTYRAWDAGGLEVDSLVIEKPADGRARRIRAGRGDGSVCRDRGIPAP